MKPQTPYKRPSAKARHRILDILGWLRAYDLGYVTHDRENVRELQRELESIKGAKQWLREAGYVG